MATKSGKGKSAGFVFVSVLPSFDDFAQAMKAGLKTPPKVKVAVEADASGLQREIEQKGQGAKVKVQADANAAGLKSEIESKGKGAKVEVTAEVNKEKFKKSLEGLKKVAEIGGVGGAIGAAGLLSGAMGQQDRAAGLQAKLGLDPKQAAAAGKMAGSIYANNFGDSAEQVTDAVATTMQSDLGSKMNPKQLQDFTSQGLQIASTFGEDYGAIMRSSSQMVRTGMAKDGTEALDILTKGMQSGANSSQDLLDTFNEYPTQFRKLGLDGATSMGLISQAMKGGARDSDLAADALKEFSIRAVDGSKTTQQGYQALGLDSQKMTEQMAKGGPAAAAGLSTVLEKLKAMKDPAAQAQAATALFGTQAEDLGKALYAFDPKTATAAMGNFAGAAKKASDAVGNTASAKISGFQRQLQTSLVNVLGNQILPIWDKFVSLVGGSNNAVSILTWGIGALAGAFALFKVAQVASTIAQWSLNGAMEANPVGLIVVAIGLVIAGVVVMYNKFGWFRDFANEVAKSVVGFITGIVEACKAVVDWAEKMGSALYNSTHDAVDTKVTSHKDMHKDRNGNVVDKNGNIITDRHGNSVAPTGTGAPKQSDTSLGGWLDNVFSGGMSKGGIMPAASGRVMPFEGIVPGWSIGKDNKLAAYAGGEGVLRQEAVAAIGPATINAWNAAARTRGSGAVSRMLAAQTAGRVVPAAGGGDSGLHIHGNVIGANEAELARHIEAGRQRRIALLPKGRSLLAST